ncbi:MAG TPA: EpsI family protein [Acidobacteriaceae bacterium]|jgi:EpsI family protein|nr:EpsI family protein [Acidobacteriaceae bacterium]
MKSLRFWVVVLLLFGCFVTLHLRGDVDRVPPTPPLTLMPETIGSWTGQDIPLDQATLDVLGDGRFLNRVYTRTGPAAAAATVPVSLFIGYFPTQRTGQSIHSPQNCLPGSGWSFLSSQVIHVTGEDGKVMQVGEYLIGNADGRQVVLYWYLAHGRSVANDYVAKAYMMLDALRSNRTDGALIRVVTPVLPTETIAQAQQRAIHFTAKMTPLLPRFIPN